jgi:NADH-quinone oxidoreductase subunit I
MVLKNLKMTLKRSVSGVEVTRLYPEKIMDLPDAERGVHVLEIRKCIGCGACVRICPNDCVKLVDYKRGNPIKNKKLQYPQIDYGRCMFCGLCVDDCPASCLIMSKAFEIAGWERDDIIYGPEKIGVGMYSDQELSELAEEARKAEEEKKRKAAEAAKAKKAKAAKAEEGETGSGEKAAKKKAE